MWSRRSDPCWHLALEEWLLDRAEPVNTLLLWQSEPAVVIGRNQNPWLETNPSLLAASGVKLVRRLSGGGAVYHDLGNLNFSFIQKRSDYSESAVVRAVIGALGRLGIAAERLPFGGLAVAGKKISGQAYCYRKNGVLHHGTLLIDADLGRLGRFLEPASWRVETKAIPSRRWPVTNLAAVVPGLAMERVLASLRESFAAAYGESCVAGIAGEPPAELVEKYRSWAWCYGETPPFSLTLEIGGQSEINLSPPHQPVVGPPILGKEGRLGEKTPPIAPTGFLELSVNHGIVRTAVIRDNLGNLGNQELAAGLVGLPVDRATARL